jgi:hypothetical protein
MCNLYKAYEGHFGDLMKRFIRIKSEGLSDNELFSQMMIDKAGAYDIQTVDVFIYSVFCYLNPPNSLGNYIKMPNNRIILEKFLSNREMVQKKIAESFEQKVAENKRMNKLQKNQFSHFEINNLENKFLMALEIVDHFKNRNVKEWLKSFVDEDNAKMTSLIYFLAHIVYDKEDVGELTEYIKSHGDLFVQKVRFNIEMNYEFVITMLLHAKPERYDLFIDEQLVQITEYIKNEKEVVISAYESDEKRYVDIIENLTSRLNQLEKENGELKNTSMKKTSPINGKNVLVVGDTGRKESYKEIVEQYGGNFDFIDGIFDKEKVGVVSERADIAILVIPRIKHTISNILKSHKVPVIFVNSAGIGTFQEVVDNYCSQ